MNDATFEAALKAIEGELITAEQLYAAAQQRVQNLQKARDGLRGLVGSSGTQGAADAPAPAAPSTTRSRPRTARAIEEIVRGRPNTDVHREEIQASLASRGLLGDSPRPDDLVRIAMKRLSDRVPEIRRVNPNTLRFDAAPELPGLDDTGDDEQGG